MARRAGAVSYTHLGREALHITYEATCEAGKLLDALHEARRRDIAAGFCTAGPHREDMGMTIDGRDAKSFASQGQKRSTVLSLKLAEAAVACDVLGEHPVMLLDDVLSELDEHRQDYLLSRIAGRQTIVTACDPGPVSYTHLDVYKRQAPCSGRRARCSSRRSWGNRARRCPLSRRDTRA